MPTLPTAQELVNAYKVGGDLTGAQITGRESLPKSPVSMLTTDSAITNLNKNVKTLNSVDPMTNGALTAPKVESKPDNKPTNNSKATFMNEGGQTLSYTQDQLNDPNVMDQIKKGGYVMTEGDGVVFDPSQPLKNELGAIDSQLQKQLDDFNAYNVDNDPMFKSTADQIRRNYMALIGETRMQNDRIARGLGRANARLGGSFSSTGMLNMTNVFAEANNKLGEIENKMNTAILEARDLYQKNKYAEFDKKVELIQKLRDNKAEELKTFNDTIGKSLKDMRDKQIQASRDSAIAGLIEQGITDPADLLNTLNYDDQGNLIGDFSADEIKKAVTNLVKVPIDKFEKASSTLKDFVLMRDNGMLPQYISSLPPEQQMGTYLQWIKGIEKGTITPNGTPVSNVKKVAPLTDLSQIDNLPVSTLTKSVMAGFGKLKDLTPTDKAKVLEEMYSVGFNPQTYIMNKLNSLVTLYSAVPEDQKGLIEGFIKPWATKTNNDVAAFESAKTVLTREVARLYDVGMLSDQDVASYKEAMPSRMDASLGVVLNKISGLSSTIVGQKAANVGKTGVLKDGRPFIVSFDGETLLDPNTGEILK